jgi:hypothetical protein
MQLADEEYNSLETQLQNLQAELTNFVDMGTLNADELDKFLV